PGTFNGLYGSSSWVVRQVIVPNTKIIIIGTPQTNASIALLWCHLGAYSAFLFEARYFQAKTKVMKITGTTTISIKSIASIINSFSFWPIIPFGFKTIALQPVSNSIKPRDINIQGLNLYFISMFTFIVI